MSAYRYRCDDKKQILAMLLSILIPVATFVLTLFVASRFIQLQENMMTISYCMFGVGMVMYIVSWAIAPKMLANREI